MYWYDGGISWHVLGNLFERSLALLHTWDNAAANLSPDSPLRFGELGMLVKLNAERVQLLLS